MLLDTHVWLWVADDSDRLGPKTRRRLAKGFRASGLSVSSASVFEITALCTAGRLGLSLPAERWIETSVQRSAFRVVPISSAIASDAGAIPASALADPIDRLLVAAARDRGVPIVTGDRQILDYASRTRLVQVIDARQ